MRVLTGSDHRNGRRSDVILWISNGTGDWQRASSIGLVSPSYLAVHPFLDVVYAVSEVQAGTVVAIDYSSGSFEPGTPRSTEGALPCHVAVNPEGEILIVSNYASGSATAFELAADGDIARRLWTREFEGDGPDPLRQESPHAHHAALTGEAILISDLGSDRIHLMSRAGEILAEIELPAGFGPRHLAPMGQNRFAIVGELQAEVAIVNLGEITHAKIDHLVPCSRDRLLAQPSGIAVHQNLVYVANRVVNTIARLAEPESLVEASSGGIGPRDIAVVQDQLWVANQDSNSVAILALPNLEQLNTLDHPSVSCIVPVPARSAR